MKIRNGDKKRPKESIERRKKSDRSITIIKDGRIIVQDGKPIKK